LSECSKQLTFKRRIHLKLKYNSIDSAIATIRIRLRILPTPKYIRRRKKLRAIVATTPRRLLAKISEKAKSRQKKARMKKSGITAKESGSTK